MKSRKPMLIVAVIIVSAIAILIFGCSHWARSKKNNGATVHAQVRRPGGKVHKLPAKAAISTNVPKPKSCACSVGSASQSLSEQTTASPLSPVVRVVVTVSSEPAPNPGFGFFQQQTERDAQPSGSGWKHFHPQTQTGQ